jgi:hypothetical protein
MKALMNLYVAVSQGRLRGRPRSVPSIIVAAGLLAMLAAGCSAAGPNSASTARGDVAAAPAPAQARVPGAAAGSVANGNSAAAGSTGTSAPLPAADQAIIYTASLTVRVLDVSQAASLAAHLATAEGGYVSSENTLADRAHPAQSTVNLQLKVPVAAYQATLDALSTQLGTRISVSQHAQDVTATVADVTSRVTSAQAAITQLRALLARAGSVGDLLNVQDQIDQEESDLESLQSQARALSHETTYATLTLVLVSKPRTVAPAHEKLAGFLGGLETGWHGLRVLVSLLLAGAGAALPFAGIAALAGYCAYRARRWLLRRRALGRQDLGGRATPPAAGPSAAG